MYRDNIAAIQINSSSETAAQLAENVDGHLQAIKYSLLPYLCEKPTNKATTKLTQADTTRLKEAWARAFGGHPDDPEMRKRIERDAKILNEAAIRDRLKAENSTDEQ
jgi:hypothetical protein